METSHVTAETALNDLVDVRTSGIHYSDELLHNILNSMSDYDLNKAKAEKKIFPPRSYPGKNKQKNKYLWVIKKALSAVDQFNSFEVIDEARVGVIKFRVKTPTRNQHCDLIVNNVIASKNSELIKRYLQLDATGKVRGFLMLTKRFVKTHGIGDAVKGFPSSYGWVVMCLHFLLRFEYIPNIQRSDVHVDRRRNRKLDFRMYEVDQTISLSATHVESLREVTAVDLLNQFLVYLYKDFNHELYCMTLRGTGNDTIVPKSLWYANYYWRLSVEDPFERLDTLKAHDLGNMMNVDTSKQLFRILGRAVEDFSNALNNESFASRSTSWSKLFFKGGNSR